MSCPAPLGRGYARRRGASNGQDTTGCRAACRHLFAIDHAVPQRGLARAALRPICRDRARRLRSRRHHRRAPWRGARRCQDRAARRHCRALGRDRPIYLGLCGSDTRALQRRLAATADWPIDGYLIACPSYRRPSQEGLRRRFTALAAAAAKPILLYNIPYRTGVNLANETLMRLAELPAIIGIKDCSAAQSSDLLRQRPPGFALLSGEDALFYGALAQGAAPPRMSILPDLLACARRCWRPTSPLRSGAGARSSTSSGCSSPSRIRRRSSIGCDAPGLIAALELRLPMTGVGPWLAGRLARISGRAMRLGHWPRP